jgi:signal transduction histidine kinase
VAALSVFAVGCALWVSRKRLREQANRRALAEAEFAAILKERNRMAREIHDTLAQGLSAISMQLELAKRKIIEAPDSVGHTLETAHTLVRQSLNEARNSIWNMRSQALESGDLKSALESVLRHLTDATNVSSKLECLGRPRRLPPVVENHLLRIGQEAITNAAKHAAARNIAVQLEFTDRLVRLTVRDDGHGFDVTQQKQPAKSFGLVGMRERAAQLHGELTVESKPGTGTTVTVTLPAPN